MAVFRSGGAMSVSSSSSFGISSYNSFVLF